MVQWLRCLFSQHASPPHRFRTHNGAVQFGECPHCLAEIVKLDGRWRAMPKGYRIRWMTRAQAMLRSGLIPAPED